MNMLYGTDAPQPKRQVLTLPGGSVVLEAGALRYLTVGGGELIRGVACLVRDADWGTLVPVISGEVLDQRDDGFDLHYRAEYVSGGAGLADDVVISAGPERLEFTAEMLATGGFQTNRAGFVVLHAAGLAGAELQVRHGDGAVDDTRFPDLIDPWQPFSDIAALTHHTGGYAVTCTFEGDTFEMEDQRQWSDASFKTYVRPLALPWPYEIGNGVRIKQAVKLRWEAEAMQPNAPVVSHPVDAVFPQTALVITADEARLAITRPQDLASIAPHRLLCHLDASAGHSLAELHAFAAVQALFPAMLFDLELIACCDDLDTEFTAIAADVTRAGLRLASVMVCPSVDRQSTPPGSAWPECPPLHAVHAAAKAAFPGMTMGGGMVSFFPELNRKRPPAGLDFISHGTCPIVHASGDDSVMETLEALPHITRSARAIIGAADYRLGPSMIAMRQNPYGSRTIPNPGRGRVCMADEDPRHAAAFGAAYTLGYATAIATAGVTVWTPAALYGSRGLFSTQGTPYPLAAVVARLAKLAGMPVGQAEITNGQARLTLGNVTLTATLSPAAPDPYGWTTAEQGGLHDPALDLMP